MSLTFLNKVSSLPSQSGNQLDYPYEAQNSESESEKTKASDNLMVIKSIRKFKSSKSGKNQSQSGSKKLVSIKRRPGAPHNTNQYLSKESVSSDGESCGFSIGRSMIGIISVEDLNRAELELSYGGSFFGKFESEMPTVTSSIENNYYPFNRGNNVTEDRTVEGKLLNEIKLRDRKIEELQDCIKNNGIVKSSVENYST